MKQTIEWLEWASSICMILLIFMIFGLIWIITSVLKIDSGIVQFITVMPYIIYIALLLVGYAIANAMKHLLTNQYSHEALSEEIENVESK